MNENKTVVSGGIGFCGLLTIVLISLKLTNLIDISWLPLFIPFILCAVILIIIVVVNAILKHKMNK